MSEFSIDKLIELLGIDKNNKIDIRFDKDEEEKKYTIYTIHDIEINSSFRTLLDEIKDNKITLEFWRCNFSANINLSNLSILPKILFHDCVFEKPFTARRSTFENEVGFIHCIFEKNVDFSSAQFQGKVIFELSHFASEVRFIKTQFKAKVSDKDNNKDTDNQTYENDFGEVHFGGNASFGSAEFSGKVNFRLSRFTSEARFNNTKFEAKILDKNTDNQTYENDFGEVHFGGNASFYSAQFQGRINFSISRFASEVSFIETKFLAEASDNQTYENNFREVYFGGDTSFGAAEFSGKVIFGLSRFASEARFDNTKFKAKVSDKDNNKDTDNQTYENNFREVYFGGNVSFGSAEFSGKVDFKLSYFTSKSRFIETKFLAEASDNQTYENDFREVHFFGGVIFNAIHFVGRVNFIMSCFKNSLFWDVDFSQTEIFF